jgi:cytochrome c-type biogenesis protein
MEAAADISLWIAFCAGILSFFSPCVLPLIPSYLTYITGLSFNQLQDEHPDHQVRMTVLRHSLLFIAGFSLVFISLGALAGIASGALIGSLQEGLSWLQKIGGLLIFLFGLHLSGILQLDDKPHGYFGTIFVGIVFAAGWTPCIGPVLGAILMVAATSGQVGKGTLLLSAYSLGLGIPFLVSGLLFHGFLSFFKRFRVYIRLFEILTGLLLMLVGVMLFFNLLTGVTGWLYRLIPMGG